MAPSRFKKLLFSHLKSSHLGLTFTSCPFCPDQFCKDSLLIQHMELEHFGTLSESGGKTTANASASSQGPPPSNPEDNLQCPVCNFRSELGVDETEKHVLTAHVDPLVEHHLVCRECSVKVRKEKEKGSNKCISFFILLYPTTNSVTT